MNQAFAEHFLTACGASEPIRVVVSKTGETVSESWVFARPFLVIGRRADSDLVLDHWQISRRHAYLQYLDGGFFCVDLGSRTGTYGGDATERAGWIAPNQTIQVGPYQVRPVWPERQVAAEPRDLPSVVWELPREARGGAMWRMERQLVLVGRSPSCRIRIVEKDVSKFHCSLIRTRLGVWVVDLFGQGGVYLNGFQVRCARLDDGDELRIGRHILRPRYDAPLPDLSRLPHEFGFDAMRNPDDIAPDQLPAVPETFPGTSTPGRLTFPAPAMPPAGTNLAAILQSQGHTIDPVMSAMVQQFGLMQQQMFDQFHQTMMAMFEGFAAMHREQSESMREEIEQVRQLSREIEALQAETERLQTEARKRESAARAAELLRPGPGVPPRPAPAASPGPSSSPTPALSSPSGPVVPGNPTRLQPLPPAETEPDIHAVLLRRLTSIHNERQGRWQKILGMMSSRS